MPSSTGSTLKSVVARLNDLAPLALAESWDNVGLLVEPSTPKLVRKVFKQWHSVVLILPLSRWFFTFLIKPTPDIQLYRYLLPS